MEGREHKAPLVPSLSNCRARILGGEGRGEGVFILAESSEFVDPSKSRLERSSAHKSVTQELMSPIVFIPSH